LISSGERNNKTEQTVAAELEKGKAEARSRQTIRHPTLVKAGEDYKKEKGELRKGGNLYLRKV